MHPQSQLLIHSSLVMDECNPGAKVVVSVVRYCAYGWKGEVAVMPFILSSSCNYSLFPRYGMIEVALCK